MFKRIVYEEDYAGFRGNIKVEIWAEDGKLHYSKEIRLRSDNVQNEISDISIETFAQKMELVNIPGWKKQYEDYNVLDGSSWEVEYETEGNEPITISGINAYPGNWKSFIKILKMVVGEMDVLY